MIRPWWWLVLGGMFAVTYSVRLIPFVHSDVTRLPLRLRRILAVVPATALGALIVPDLWFAFPHTGGGSAGTIAILLSSGAVVAAAIIAARGGGLILSVLAAIGLAWAGVMLWL